MWTTQKNNLLCSYLDAYEDQKKHIERVLSAKDTTRSTIPPYYPKFLKLKVCKYHMEEEKNEQIREENKILYLKIKDVIKKPSKYSKLFEPKKCPAFDKEKILLKRIKHEINNYQENIRFYHRIENANSFYPKKDLLKRKKELEENLMFSSPERIKNEIERYKNKRNKSAKRRSRPMTQQTTARKSNNNEINKNSNIKDNKSNKKEINNESEKKEQISDQKNYNKINKRNGNIKKNNSNSKKLSRNTSESKMSKKNKNNDNENDKNKRSKSTLKRNESEINLLG